MDEFTREFMIALLQSRMTWKQAKAIVQDIDAWLQRNNLEIIKKDEK